MRQFSLPFLWSSLWENTRSPISLELTSWVLMLGPELVLTLAAPMGGWGWGVGLQTALERQPARRDLEETRRTAPGDPSDPCGTGEGVLWAWNMHSELRAMWTLIKGGGTVRLWTPGWLPPVPGPTVLDYHITARHSPARPHSSHRPPGCARELKCATVGRERGGSTQRRGADSRGAPQGRPCPGPSPRPREPREAGRPRPLTATVFLSSLHLSPGPAPTSS